MRTIYHVTLLSPQEGESKNYYFGCMAAIFDTLDSEQVGITYGSLRHVELTEKDYVNDKCIIRRGELIVKSKKV